MRGHQIGQFRDQLRTVAETDLGIEPILHGRQAQRLEPGDRRVECCTVLQANVLHGRTAPQCEGLAEPPWILLIAGLADEAFEPHGVDSVGFHRQPVAVHLRLDQPLRQRLPQAGDQALQRIRRVGGGPLTPDPIDERRLRNDLTRCEREGDQESAQPGARHVGHDAVSRANLERSKHPDVHAADFAIGN